MQDQRITTTHDDGVIYANANVNIQMHLRITGNILFNAANKTWGSNLNCIDILTYYSSFFDITDTD